VSPLDLPPDLRTRLRRLSITPRRPAVLASAGQHASRNRGGSQEFAQYRTYERGDDLRRPRTLMLQQLYRQRRKAIGSNKDDAA
jgi:hypothetical protein